MCRFEFTDRYGESRITLQSENMTDIGPVITGLDCSSASIVNNETTGLYTWILCGNGQFIGPFVLQRNAEIFARMNDLKL